jgi:hypothetical protein
VSFAGDASVLGDCRERFKDYQTLVVDFFFSTKLRENLQYCGWIMRSLSVVEFISILNALYLRNLGRVSHWRLKNGTDLHLHAFHAIFGGTVVRVRLKDFSDAPKKMKHILYLSSFAKGVGLVADVLEEWKSELKKNSIRR